MRDGRRRGITVWFAAIVVTLAGCGGGELSGQGVQPPVPEATTPSHAPPLTDTQRPGDAGGLPWCVDLRPRPAEPDGPVSANSAVAAQQRGRAHYGLASDEASTRAAMGADDASHEWGFATTPNESRELMTGRSGGATARVAERYGRRHAAFAGLWVDQSTGGTVTVAFTNQVRRHRHALREVLAPTEITVVDAEHTAAELRAARAEVSRDFAEGGGNVVWTSLGTDVLANRVMIGLASNDQHMRDTLEARYGDLPVCVEITGEIRPVAAPR